MADRDLGVRSAGVPSTSARRTATLPTFTSQQIRRGTAVKSVPKKAALDKALKAGRGVERAYSKREPTETEVASGSRESRGWIQNAAQAQHAVRMLDLRLKREMQETLRLISDGQADGLDGQGSAFSPESFVALSNPAAKQVSSSVLSGSMDSASAFDFSAEQSTPIYTSHNLGLAGVLDSVSGQHLSLDLRGIPGAVHSTAGGQEVPDSQDRESSSTPVRTWEGFQQAEAAAIAATVKSDSFAHVHVDSTAPLPSTGHDHVKTADQETQLYEEKKNAVPAGDGKTHMLVGKVRSLEAQLEVQRQTSAKLAAMCKSNQTKYQEALQRELKHHNAKCQKLQESEVQLIERVQQLELAERKAQKRKNEPWRDESLENECCRLKEKLSEMQGKISKETLRAVKAEQQLEKHAADHKAAIQKMQKSHTTLRHSIEDKQTLLFAMEQESGTRSNALQNLREYCRRLEADKLSLTAALGDAEAHNEALRREATENEAERTRARQHIERLQEVGGELEEKHQDKARTVESLQADVQRLQGMVAELEEERGKARQRAEEQAETTRLLQGRHEAVASQYRELEEALRKVHAKQAAEHQATVEKVQEDYVERMREQQQALLQQLAEKEAAAVALEGERARLQHGSSLLKQVQESAAAEHRQQLAALERKASQETETAQLLQGRVEVLTQEKGELEEQLRGREQRGKEEVERLVREHAAERLRLRRLLEEEREELRKEREEEREEMRRRWEGEREEARAAGRREREEVLERARSVAALEREQLQGRVAELRGEVEAMERKVGALEAEREREREVERAREREKEREREREAEEKVGEAERKREEVRGAAEALGRQVEALRAQLAGREGEAAGAKAELRGAQERVAQLEERAQGAERRAREAEAGKAAVELSLLAMGEEASAAREEARVAEGRRREAEGQADALERRLREEEAARSRAEQALGLGQRGSGRHDSEQERDGGGGGEKGVGGVKGRGGSGDEGGGEEGLGGGEQAVQIRSLRRYVHLLESRVAQQQHATLPPPSLAAKTRPAVAHSSPGASSKVALLEQRLAQYEVEAREWEQLRTELCCKVAALEGRTTRLSASEEAEAVQVRKYEILAAQRAEENGVLRQRAVALEEEAGRRRGEAEKLRGEVEKLRHRNMQLEDEVVRRQLEAERASRERGAERGELRRVRAEAEASARRAEEQGREAERERKRASGLASELNNARLKHWLALPPAEQSAAPVPRVLSVLAAPPAGVAEPESAEEVAALVGLVEKLLREREAAPRGGEERPAAARPRGTERDGERSLPNALSAAVPVP